MKPVKIDVMLNGRFVCQLDYIAPFNPLIYDGEIINVYNYDDMRNFVFSKRPSLKGKDIMIEFTSQKVV